VKGIFLFLRNVYAKIMRLLPPIVSALGVFVLVVVFLVVVVVRTVAIVATTVAGAAGAAGVVAATHLQLQRRRQVDCLALNIHKNKFLCVKCKKKTEKNLTWALFSLLLLLLLVFLLFVFGKVAPTSSGC
jgi:hypothetical protein